MVMGRLNIGMRSALFEARSIPSAKRIRSLLQRCVIVFIAPRSATPTLLVAIELAEPESVTGNWL